MLLAKNHNSTFEFVKVIYKVLLVFGGEHAVYSGNMTFTGRILLTFSVNYNMDAALSLLADSEAMIGNGYVINYCE